MLREEKVSRASYDAGRDELTLDCSVDARLPGGGNVDAQLLLDRAGFLVGVDLGEEPQRVVAMLGRHEDVDRTSAGRVRVSGHTIVIADAKKRARAHEPSPYKV